MQAASLLLKSFFIFFFFVGADSPQAVRKLLALSDPNKVRPHQPLRPPVSGSPSLSPVSVRRCHDPRPSFSAEVGSASVPVDLYPESSSVTSFGAASIKKSQTSGIYPIKSIETLVKEDFKSKSSPSILRFLEIKISFKCPKVFLFK